MKENYYLDYELYYTLTLTTKNKKPTITPEIKECIANNINRNAASWNISEIKIDSHTPDNITIHFKASPTTELSKMINSLKTVTSRAIHKDFPNTKNLSIWQKGYGLFSKCDQNSDVSSKLDKHNKRILPNA